MLFNAIKRLAVADDGAVTVDWVVLTAAIVAFAAGAALVALPGIGPLASNIGATTGELQVGFEQLGRAGDGAGAGAEAETPGP
jgi:hypothetical protein